MDLGGIIIEKIKIKYAFNLANGECILVTESGEQIQIWGSIMFVGPIEAKKINNYTVHVTPVCEHTTIRTVEEQQIDPPMPTTGSLIYSRIEARDRQIERDTVEIEIVEVIMLKMVK